MQEVPRTPSEPLPIASSPAGSFSKRVLAILYYLGLASLPFLLGGVLHLAIFETPGPNLADDRGPLYFGIGLLILAAFWVVLFGIPLLMRHPKRLVFGTLWCLFLTAGVLILSEWALRLVTPTWPTLALHGVPPDTARKAWAAKNVGEDDLNGWGQRDRNRSLKKPEGTFRIALIGDSFLEESTSLPLSRIIEEKLNRPDVEVLNLGVSATEPDEYYYRVRNIALALDVDHCIVCLYSGNDFTAPARTLDTTAGIVAVAPRGSLFSALGLHAWNHHLTNHNRPVLKAWLTAGNLLAAETRLAEAIAAADDQGLRNLLYSLNYSQCSPTQLRRLAERLNAPEMTEFFEMLRHPDKELFRSYYLSYGLWSASVGGGQWERLSEDNAYHWVRQAFQVCQASDVGFTLVIIPEAFQVDPRMVEQWKPLTDMRGLMKTCRTTSERMLQRVRRDRMAAIDLHEAFDGVPGTYLNLDGHWSDRGAELAADVISQWLLQSVLSVGP